jgi:hypothetical protein
MKKLVFIAVILLSIPFLSTAQEDTIPKIYRAWITLNNNSPEVKGVLFETKDSSISITNSFSRSDYLSGNFNVTTIYYNNIYKINARRNNSVIAGFFLGAAAGAITGAIIGGSKGDDVCPAHHLCLFQMTAGQKAALGTLCSIPGATTGMIIGQIRIKIPINGSIQTFHKNKERLKKYSYLH